MLANSNINTLTIVNISIEQLPVLKQALNDQHFYFTAIDTGGGILSNQTQTLFIGLNISRYDELVRLLTTYCKTRRTHIATQSQMEIHLQPHQPIIIEAETGGATIFTIPVEHFEQY